MKRSLASRAARLLLFSILAAGGSFAGFSVQAQQAWPARPVRMIMPFPPGGGSDIVVRVAAQSLTTRTGQQFLVENVSGAGRG